MKIEAKTRFKKTLVGRALSLLSAGEKTKVILLMASQILISLLDLVGVTLVGIVGALAVSSIESRTPVGKIHTVLVWVGISDVNYRTQILILGLFAGVFLVGKSFISAYLTRRILLFLSYRGAKLSGKLISSLLAQSSLFIRRRTEKEIIYALTAGVEDLAIRILGTVATLASDLSLLVFLAVGLIAIQPFVALSGFIFFGLIVLALHLTVNRRLVYIGQEITKRGIRSSEDIAQAIYSFRELSVKGQLPYYSHKILKNREQLAEVQAELSFVPSIGKYVIETSLVLGSILLSGVQFALSDAVHAVSTLAIFLAAGSRIAPALLRIQQGVGTFKASKSSAELALNLASDLGSEIQVPAQVINSFTQKHEGFISSIKIEKVSMTYPDATNSALSDISLTIQPGNFVAVVGPSGSGKTTLIDVILGLLTPESGSVEISNDLPRNVISRWPGAIAYVPQEIIVSNGSLRENVTLGFGSEEISDEQIWEALRAAELEDFVESLEQKLNAVVGETGIKLSGGQRQRLSIARALITKPSILILDEATSALDAEIENKITQSLLRLKGKITIVMIAHRLATVRGADLIAYLENGVLKAVGSFEEVRKIEPDFDRQAKLLGL